MLDVTVAAKIPPDLKEQLEAIAELERRTISSVVRLALENYVQQHAAIHPRFHADILEALEGVGRGEAEPYVRG